MSLITYPRTDAGGADGSQASIMMLEAALYDLSVGRDPQYAAEIAIRTLEILSRRGGCDDGEMVTHALELRKLTYGHWLRARRDRLFLRAMEICSTHWQMLHPIEKMSFGSISEALAVKKEAARTSYEKRKISEQLGIISALYQISAFVGHDIGPLARSGATIDLSRYQAVQLEGDRIVYFHSMGPYNVNVVYSLYIPGFNEPIVIVAEAKGGDSPYDTLLGGLRQDNFQYPINRAQRMKKAKGKQWVPEIRRGVGELILDAAKAKRLVYIGARGFAEDGKFEHKLIFRMYGAQ